MNIEYKRFILSLVPPSLLILLLWLVKLVEVGGNFDFYYFGLFPRKLSGLTGVLAAPLIHANFSHLINNSVPFLLLLTAIFYFYSQVAWRVLLYSYLVPGILAWVIARPSYHIGASGLVYSFFSFLFFSGIIRRNLNLLAISLLVSFLYGSMVWGIFPYRPDTSWESHLTGLITGFVLSVHFRHEGPGPSRFIKDMEDDEEEDEGTEPENYWQNTDKHMSKDSMTFSLMMLCMVVLLASCGLKPGMQEEGRTVSFDSGWRFLLEDPSGAENEDFDDSGWRLIDLPHDWSIEDLPDQGDSVIGPFSKSSAGKMATGYTVGGTAWYRKAFTISPDAGEKVVYLGFDGVYMNADIWINGHHAGNHPYGYTSFFFNITPYLNPAGKPNVVAVQVKNEGRNSRWYSGSGIYRHAWLTVVDPVHIDMWGVFVTTPVAMAESASVCVQTTCKNLTGESVDVTVRTIITDPKGSVAGTSETSLNLSPGKTSASLQSFSVKLPVLWSTENPALYKAGVTLITEGREVDSLAVDFGIRSLGFDAESGFALNGRSMELRGGCFHHDNGVLGSAAIDRAEERKIELLKKAGFNAIRCSHNPPSPYLLDACDRLGMLVIDEAFDMWTTHKTSEDYAGYFINNWKEDLRSMILRDRNHPSVIMWSIGNEIPESGNEIGFEIAREMTAEVRRLDTTRAVTEAMVDFAGMISGKSNWDDRAPCMEMLDVVGYNYGFTKYEQDHLKYPGRVMYASESMPPLALQDWQQVERLPYVFGSFTWTAMDYLGEAGVGMPRLINNEDETSPDMSESLSVFFNSDSWPLFNNYQGDLDLTGNPKAPWYYRQVVWRESKVEMLVHRPLPPGKKELTSLWGFPDELKSWNWAGHEGEKMLVHVYTRSRLVKLELNGKTVGEQAVDDNISITASFEVPYEAGTLTARCFDDGMETATRTISTTGNPAAIRLVADRSRIKADRNDLSYVMVEITDAEGNLVPSADNVPVEFEISGKGKIEAVGNGNPSDMSSFRQPRKRTWQGRCLAVIRPVGKAGRIVFKARADGLKEGVIEIMAE